MLFVLALVACDDGPATPPDLGVDAGLDLSVDADSSDLGTPPDGRLDASPPDVGPDALVDALVDAAPPPLLCPDRSSPRPPGTWRTRGCAFVVDDDTERLPRAVVVSGDSLVRDARTSLHTAAEYADLAGRADWVWLLVTWDGIEPSPGTYNGAYLGRVCQQVDLAAAAGLGVVLAMHQERFGPALGGHGLPDWLVPTPAQVPPDAPDHPAVQAAWQAFWSDPARPAALVAAWDRLLRTCAGRAGIVGVHPLVDVRGPAEATAALFQEIRTLAEASFGPLLMFYDGEVVGSGPDVVRAPTAFGPGRGPAGAVSPADATLWLAAEATRARREGVPLFVRGAGADELDAALAQVEEVGAAFAVWHDGFGLDALALRDDEGRPNDRFPVALDRTRPLALAGVLRGFGPEAGEGAMGWRLRWHADGRNAGLSRIAVGPLGPDPVATLEPPETQWFSGFDAITGELSVFVQGAAGPVVLHLQPRGVP